MTITTQRTKSGKYLVSASQGKGTFMAASHSRAEAFSKAVDGCYKYVEESNK